MSAENSSTDSRVAKKWLTSWKVWLVWDVIGLLWYLFEARKFTESHAEDVEGVIACFAGLLWCWVGYHCAYIQKGTKFLVFFTICIAFGALMEIKSFAEEREMTMVLSLYFIASFLMRGWLFYTSTKLYEFNKALKKKNSEQNAKDFAG